MYDNVICKDLLYGCHNKITNEKACLSYLVWFKGENGHVYMKYGYTEMRSLIKGVCERKILGNAAIDHYVTEFFYSFPVNLRDVVNLFLYFISFIMQLLDLVSFVYIGTMKHYAQCSEIVDCMFQLNYFWGKE